MRFATLCLGLASVVGMAGGARACNIPVFRYAIENWKPAPFEVVVFHKGAMTDAERAAVKEIANRAAAANAEVVAFDLDGRRESNLHQIWKKHGGDAPLPWILVCFPDRELKNPIAWSGPLDLAKMMPFFESPMRRKIADRLFRGDSAVFLLLESNDAKADAAAEKLIQAELPRLEKAIRLPVLKAEDKLASKVPLRVGFPYLKVSRKSANESAFIDMLMRCQDGLDRAEGPVIFIVYGRGRVLTALHGNDVNAEELFGTTRYLCGPCSCQVKELNPGADLLFAVRWERFLNLGDEPVVPVPSERKP